VTTPKIDARRIHDLLVAARPGEAPVVSIYFTSETPLGTDSVALRDLVRQGEEKIRVASLDATSREAARHALAAAAAAIDPTATRRGTLIAFASADRADAFVLPLRLKSRVEIGWRPYVSPLAGVIEQGDRYAIVIADHRHGRILSSFLGELEELESVEDPSEQNVARAGFLGLEQSRMNGHHEVLLHRHLQRLADRLFAHHKSAAFDRIVLSAHPPATLSKLERALHASLAARVVARESWDPRATGDEVRAHVARIGSFVDAENERRLLSRVRDHATGDMHATTGADATLEAVWAGRAAMVILPAGAPIEGVSCASCGFVAAASGEARRDASRCRQCGGTTRKTVDLVEAAAELALRADSKVRLVSHAKDELESLGGMAATLRYV
jgi:peptide subunit release factor 1 (eRF1)